jgi:radical SAM enzyme (TIGR01210 family)
MTIIKLVFPLIAFLKKTTGKKGGEFFLNLVTKKKQFYSIDSLYDFDEKKAISRLSLSLPGRGCSWAKKTGGCTMCGFYQSVEQINKNFGSDDLIALYKIAEIMTTEDRPVMLTIYNAGSFINDEEIPLKAQEEIFFKVKNHPTIKKLFIESRAEFVTEEKIKILKEAIGRKKIIVGIGLEAQDDKIRNVFIHKGLSKKTYEKAIKILKQNRIKTATYVLIKPIYLDEKQAIKEAIKTAEYAFRAGSDEVIFESSFVQRGTLMEKLYNEKKFSPPWLWSVIEVIKKTNHLGSVRLGGFEDQPPPIAIPSNCPLCSKRIRENLQIYRETNDIDAINNLYCKCKKSWEKFKL